MAHHTTFVTAAQAAQRLGVSPKALRLYEEKGLLAPGRSAAGYRVYGPDHMSRASEVVALRTLGLSLAQVARVLGEDVSGLDAALHAHEARLQADAHRLEGLRARVRAVRGQLAQGLVPSAGELAQLASADTAPVVAFQLPWPWGGELFELRAVKKINYITGPLGSGKTRLAKRLAESWPGGAFIGLERLEDDAAAAHAAVQADTRLAERVEAIAAWLEDEGATRSAALIALLVAIDADGPTALVVDMVEDGLDEATQEAVAAYLRQSYARERPLFLMTRSSAILDLQALTASETLIYCPANHSPPWQVDPVPGALGYDSVASCLAPPAVRARTQGTLAARTG